MKRVPTITALILVSVVLASSLWLGCSAPASKETPQEFYKGKGGVIVVGLAPGGTYDTVARAMVPYLNQFTGATWTINNMSGGGGAEALNYVYNAKPDGLTIHVASTQTAIVGQVAGMPEAKYDMRKFEYLGSVRYGDFTFFLSTRFPFKTLKEVVDSGQVIRFGTTSRTTHASWVPLLVYKNLGMKVKVIAGYSGGGELFKAMLGGENDASVWGVLAAKALMTAGQVRPIVLMTSAKVATSPDVPTVFESPVLTADARWWCERFAEATKVSATYVTPSGVPQDRVDFLRAAIEKTMKEKTLNDQILKADVVGIWVSGQESKETILKWLDMPADKVKALKEALTE